MLRIFEILVEGLFLYLLYKLIFNFIIPVYRSFKKARRQMEEMKNQMNDQMNGNRKQHFSTSKPRDKNKKTKSQSWTHSSNSSEEGEYIDYEEVQ